MRNISPTPPPYILSRTLYVPDNKQNPFMSDSLTYFWSQRNKKVFHVHKNLHRTNIYYLGHENKKNRSVYKKNIG
jgi:hypothetical protein